jgi:hypothetical protein
VTLIALIAIIDLIASILLSRANVQHSRWHAGALAPRHTDADRHMLEVKLEVKQTGNKKDYV